MKSTKQKKIGWTVMAVGLVLALVGGMLQVAIDAIGIIGVVGLIGGFMLKEYGHTKELRHLGKDFQALFDKDEK